LRPSWSLLLTATVLVAVTLLTLRGALLYVEWIVNSRTYVAWTKSPEAQACQEIKSACHAKYLEEVASSGSGKDEKNIFALILDEVRCVEKNKPAALYCDENAPTEPSISDILMSPWTLLSAVIPIAFFSVRRYYSMNHLGWQRVSALLSVAVGLGMLVYVFQDWTFNWYELPTIVLVVLAPAFSILALPVMVRFAYGWLSEGFKADTSTVKVGVPESENAQPIERLPLTWSSIRPILYTCLIILGVLLSILFFPEKSAKAMISGLVSSVGVVAVVWIFGKIRKGSGK
jgi:hypothetical protein